MQKAAGSILLAMNPSLFRYSRTAWFGNASLSRAHKPLLSLYTPEIMLQRVFPGTALSSRPVPSRPIAVSTCPDPVSSRLSSSKKNPTRYMHPLLSGLGSDQSKHARKTRVMPTTPGARRPSAPSTSFPVMSASCGAPCVRGCSGVVFSYTLVVSVSSRSFIVSVHSCGDDAVTVPRAPRAGTSAAGCPSTCPPTTRPPW